MEMSQSDRVALTRRGALVRLGVAGAGLALATREHSVFAQAATPAAGTLPPIVQQWLDAWMSGDPVANLTPLYTADGIYEDVPSGQKGQGAAGIAGLVGGFLKVVSDVVFTPTSAFATADHAAFEYQFGLTNHGLFPGAEGKSFTTRNVTIFDLEGDKIRRSSDYYDVATALMQLGLLSFGPPAATPSS